MEIFAAKGNTFCVHAPCQNLHPYPIHMQLSVG
jgi:hypothetical protein